MSHFESSHVNLFWNECTTITYLCCTWLFLYDGGCVGTYYNLWSSWSYLFNKSNQCLLYFFFLSSFSLSFFLTFYTLFLSIFIFFSCCFLFPSQKCFYLHILGTVFYFLFLLQSILFNLFFSIPPSFSLFLSCLFLFIFLIDSILFFFVHSFFCSDCSGALSFTLRNFHSSVHSVFSHFTPNYLV